MFKLWPNALETAKKDAVFNNGVLWFIFKIFYPLPGLNTQCLKQYFRPSAIQKIWKLFGMFVKFPFLRKKENIFVAYHQFWILKCTSTCSVRQLGSILFSLVTFRLISNFYMISTTFSGQLDYRIKSVHRREKNYSSPRPPVPYYISSRIKQKQTVFVSQL